MDLACAFRPLDAGNGVARRYSRLIVVIVNRRLGIAFAAIYAVFLLLPNFVWLWVCDGRYVDHSVPYAFMSGLLPSLVMISTVFAALGRVPWLALLILLPFVPLVPIETAYVSHYGEPSWYAIIATIFESNSHEIIDFLGALVWPLLAACAASALLAVSAIYYVRKSRIVWSGRVRAWTLMAGTTIILLFAVFWLIQPPAAEGDGQGHTWPRWAAVIEPSFPLGMPIRFLHYRAEWEATRDTAAQLANFRFGTRVVHSPGRRQVHVLVIGEASRRDRWQLYGYERKTTPELARTSNLIRFDDVITPAGESRDSVPVIVSRKPGNMKPSDFHERSITAAFAEAGYETYWFSNQLAVGHFDSPIAVVAYDAAHVSFYSVADWGKAGTYDDVLLQPLREAIGSSRKDLFIVLHTMGSHANYAHRYPAEFDVYKPSLKEIVEPDYYDLSLRGRVRNSYDNSILYTDHFIAQVIATLASTEAITTMWYVSDHGEDFASESCKLAGHGNGTVNDFRIPSVFWYSDAYASEFPAVLEQARAHSGMRMSTEDMFESVIDMAGLEFRGHDSTRSIFSPAWLPHQRIVSGLGLIQMDYDTATVSDNCHLMIPAH